jgi:hypothetical protein
VAVMLVHGEEEQNGEDRTQAVALQLSESERERERRHRAASLGASRPR